MREIVIRAGKVSIRARLLETPTADRIWAALPISGLAKTWGKEVSFRAPISHDLEPDARAVASKGEIAFWPDGDAIAIGFGPTPISRRGEIRFTSRCNIWALALDDVDQLKSVYAGETISVSEAEQSPQWIAGAPGSEGRAATHAMHAGPCPSADDAKR